MRPARAARQSEQSRAPCIGPVPVAVKRAALRAGVVAARRFACRKNRRISPLDGGGARGQTAPLGALPDQDAPLHADAGLFFQPCAIVCRRGLVPEDDAVCAPECRRLRGADDGVAVARLTECNGRNAIEAKTNASVALAGNMRSARARARFAFKKRFRRCAGRSSRDACDSPRAVRRRGNRR